MKPARSIVETYSRKPFLKYQVDIDGNIINDSIGAVKRRDGYSSDTINQFLTAAFLPQGFPHSVTNDYATYQMWDTLQALASSLTGALATEAVLTGAGVGNKDATALAATITWLLKDGCGMIGRIMFSYAKGTELDAESKKWRLVADILNDASFFIDLLSPLFASLFLPLACLSSLLRCIVGVAGGATRTAIVQHQARRNNLADVSSKDGSQETLVNVIALLLSLILLPTVSGKPVIIWSLFALFTFVHLYSNWRAVRSLQFDVLNRNRAVLVIRHCLSESSPLSIIDCNTREPLFSCLLPSSLLGCSRHELLLRAKAAGAKIVEREMYVLCSGSVEGVSMRRGATPSDQLLAVFELEWIRSGSKGSFVVESEKLMGVVKAAGWKVDGSLLCFDEWEWEDTK